eukprot:CAMPEP_0175119680 /NCGR_PEP_ID=MMETSP0087-20121206/198_1 /TAXON_ID=136419 /ORGANISM="Unknown Unknown, Strain D1" /LENGTH=801 /DNA_ID=CAMNT_0016401039 /DNA_START=11 /DNA_END=2416 /DNA_ORIENTATION=-
MGMTGESSRAGDTHHMANSNGVQDAEEVDWDGVGEGGHVAAVFALASCGSCCLVPQTDGGAENDLCNDGGVDVEIVNLHCPISLVTFPDYTSNTAVSTTLTSSLGTTASAIDNDNHNDSVVTSTLTSPPSPSPTPLIVATSTNQLAQIAAANHLATPANHKRSRSSDHLAHSAHSSGEVQGCSEKRKRLGGGASSSSASIATSSSLSQTQRATSSSSNSSSSSSGSSEGHRNPAGWVDFSAVSSCWSAQAKQAMREEYAKRKPGKYAEKVVEEIVHRGRHHGVSMLDVENTLLSCSHDNQTGWQRKGRHKRGRTVFCQHPTCCVRVRKSSSSNSFSATPATPLVAPVTTSITAAVATSSAATTSGREKDKKRKHSSSEPVRGQQRRAHWRRKDKSRKYELVPWTTDLIRSAMLDLMNTDRVILTHGFAGARYVSSQYKRWWCVPDAEATAEEATPNKKPAGASSAKPAVSPGPLIAVNLTRTSSGKTSSISFSSSPVGSRAGAEDVGSATLLAASSVDDEDACPSVSSSFVAAAAADPATAVAPLDSAPFTISPIFSTAAGGGYNSLSSDESDLACSSCSCSDCCQSDQEEDKLESQRKRPKFSTPENGKFSSGEEESQKKSRKSKKKLKGKQKRKKDDWPPSNVTTSALPAKVDTEPAGQRGSRPLPVPPVPSAPELDVPVPVPPPSTPAVDLEEECEHFSVVHPWIMLSGNLNMPFLNVLTNNLLSLVIHRPGISLATLSKRFPVLTPVEIEHVLKLLEFDGKITIRVISVQKASLFSPKRAGVAKAQQTFYFPTRTAI